jgi:hypothetical protein
MLHKVLYLQVHDNGDLKKKKKKKKKNSNVSNAGNDEVDEKINSPEGRLVRERREGIK